MVFKSPKDRFSLSRSFSRSSPSTWVDQHCLYSQLDSRLLKQLITHCISDGMIEMAVHVQEMKENRRQQPENKKK